MKILLSGTASDSHTWNLVYLGLFLEERAHDVVALGPCVSPRLLTAACRRHAPDAVVLSSVNGHGYRDALAAVRALRAEPELAALPVAVGGKLGTAGRSGEAEAARLREAGCDAVLGDGAGDLEALGAFLTARARVVA
ncbi:methylaspartate mutase sigma subunit [Streptomyces sp. KhCrAH-43]|uniref:cobalamin B12-binding domain-containing protein n=1 Tax=Streptomyces TaxID=1883 RepID=UPI00037D75E8|nr:MULTISPECIES: cobalamin-dependent protein [unclassified Streptomyces]MYS39210.1 methylaspartate mutase [Streptomyces sp. SID4920]MYX69525.1 methylaspartate mutase [Streptomyces sp. SID8373]RAJ59460.1 methylaspartate mutase sigma subunit [Streptomyces sp. KhCrAH-43]